VLTEADVGATMAARATYTDGHGTAEQVDSTPTAAVANVNDAATGAVSISGTPTQGQTLTASHTLADADGLGAITYHWLRNGGDIGATGSSYVLTEADVGATMTARATYTDGHGTAEAVDSTPTTAIANLNDSPTGSVNISGVTTQGQLLTASHSLLDADGMGTVSYQWWRGSTNTGVTTSSYTLGEADVGQQLFVRATYTDGHGHTEQIDSAATAPIAHTPDSAQPGGDAIVELPPADPATLTHDGHAAAPDTKAPDPHTVDTAKPAGPSTSAVATGSPARSAATTDPTSQAILIPNHKANDPRLAVLLSTGAGGQAPGSSSVDSGPVGIWQVNAAMPSTDNASDSFLRQLLAPRLSPAPNETFSLSIISADAAGRTAPAAPLSFAESPQEGQLKIQQMSIQATGAALSIGTVWWAARISGLLTSLAISTPAWRAIDPLPVLGSDGPATDDDSDDTAGPSTQPGNELEGRAARLFDDKPGASHSMESIG
jgi:hypothetical protein